MSPKAWTFASCAGLFVTAVVALGGCTSSTAGRFCYGNGVCCDQSTPVVCTCADGVSCCNPDGTKCAPTSDIDHPSDQGEGDVPPSDVIPTEPKLACQILKPVTSGPPNLIDTDGDGISDVLEDKNGNGIVDPGETDPKNPDTDGDGVYDGCEDKNLNGVRDPGEMDPTRADTDGDGIPDGIEDANHNGRYDIPAETNPLSDDTDGDGIKDGVEDRNRDGKVTVWKPHDPATDLNDNGCYDVGEPGESDPRLADSDGDGIPDNVEDVNKNGICDAGETCLYAADTDCDGIIDGLEDKNHNGRVDRGETDPLDPDTDHDGLPDGVEDANHDGAYDAATETSPLLPDSDFDGIPDGIEDLNHNGVVDTYDTNLGCWSPDLGLCTDKSICYVGGTACKDGSACLVLGQCSDHTLCTVGGPACANASTCVPVHGESDPRLYDTDGDGIPDGVEDANRDGKCDTAMLPDRKDPTKNVRTFVETCAWLADTDCDGLPDGLEDKNLSGGPPDPGETDPRQVDSDLDGLYDGQNDAWMPLDRSMCEDCNNNGLVDVGETDPSDYDTDRDGLSDGCERRFADAIHPPDSAHTADWTVVGPTDPLNPDSDGDGILDGDEDKNHNCRWDPGETDPRVANEKPLVGTEEAAVYEVCGAKNLKQLTFARTTRVELDYQLALEVEKSADTGAQSLYDTNGFGYDLASNPDGILDLAKDRLLGHAFQSTKGVIPDTVPPYAPVNGLVYGFILAADATGGLDNALNLRREALAAMYPDGSVSGVPYKGVEELPTVTARPAHDDLPNFPVLRAQRRYRVRLSSAKTAIDVRNQLLDAFVKPPTTGNTGSTVVWEKTKPTVDVTFPAGVSPGNYDHFALYVGAVERVKQTGPDGGPLMLLVLTLTPDDSASGADATRLYNDRLSRLEDLTGGSALARTGNGISNTCEKKNAKRAAADLLWVVDDSSSMQSIIKRLQTAASDQHAVLSANANVVDFRVAMTTTNPSRTARTRCYQSPSVTCDGACQGNLACNDVCADQWVGCIFVCPSTWVLTGLCDPTTGLCTCPAANASQCTASNGKCVDPSAPALGIFGDGAVAANQLPGGGGTFYFESGRLLDCNSASTTGQNKFINYCGWVSPFGAEFAPFLSAVMGSDALHGAYYTPVAFADAGFLGSSPSTACDTGKSLMDLSADASTTGTCGSNLQNPPLYCCPRLTAGSSCADGPTVLESQMCDLIRAMGGLPESNPSIAGASGRAHAATEMGSREARRLLTTLLPAYPKDSTKSDKGSHLRLDCCTSCSPSDPTCAAMCCNSCDTQTCPKSNPNCCNQAALGLDCNISAQCQECDPRNGGYCPTTPLVTLILSDEEDYWFKDECYVNPFALTSPASPSIDDIDKTPLPTQCRFADGDSSTLEDCTAAYCSSQGFALDPPAGYNPDQPAWTSLRSGTLKLRPACYQIYPGTPTGACTDATTCQTLCGKTAGCAWNSTAVRCEETTKSCSPYLGDAAVSCVGDPCPQLHDSASCDTFKTYFADTKFDALRAVKAFGSNLCVWDAGSSTCRNACNAITAGYLTSVPADYLTAKTACEGDARCQWNASQFSTAGDTDMRRACELKLELNDCRACKRFKRLQDSVAGESGNDARCALHSSAGACEIDFGCRWNATTSACTSLAGLGIAGPVYSITREAGKPGAGGWSGTQQVTTDECNGASSTWGRGDGGAYRALSSATQGLTQNICAKSYKDFMQLLVTNIVALSKPYPLAGNPIASTIKVGLARPNGTAWDYVPVERSLTRGWNYNATANSLGFKNDPIDGECKYPEATGPHSCSVTGVIEPSEITSAQSFPFVPHDKDVVIISYRLWQPVPCRDECLAGTTCTRVYCTASDAQPACVVDSDCPDLDDKCNAGKCTCVPGTVVDRCRAEACGPCQYLDTSVAPATCKAEPIVAGVCNCTGLSGTPCTPGGPNVCPIGQMCDESGCVCRSVGTCPGVDFDAQGYFSVTGSCPVLADCAECKAAMTCCSEWSGAAESCGAVKTAAACNGTAGCAWAAQGGTCVSSSFPQPCCNPGEAPSCFWDPQSNKASIACKPATCACSDPRTCQVGCEGLALSACGSTAGCSWDAGRLKCYATGCQFSWKTCKGGTECTPACQPQTQFCDISAGCVCTNNPG